MDTSALIAYIDEEDQESLKLFTSFAESHQNDFVFGISSDMDLAEREVSKRPFIVLYNPLDQVQPVFEDEFKIDSIEDFIGRHTTPLIGTFSLETYYAYTEVIIPLSNIAYFVH